MHYGVGVLLSHTPEPMRKPQIALMLILFLASTLNADVYDTHTYKVFYIRIHHHLFDPDIIVVQAHVIIKLVFENQDDQAEKIFSHSLNVEKIILGHSSGFVFVGPLEEGDYPQQGRFFSRSVVGVVQAAGFTHKQ